MSVDINAAKFSAALKRMAARFEREVDRAMDVVSEVGLRSLKRTTRFQDRTGNLRASFFRMAGSSFGERVISAGMPYAFFLEFGTRTITPRPFMNDAREVVAMAIPIAMEDAVRRATHG